MFVGDAGFGKRRSITYKSKYGGMKPADTRRLKSLEDENANLEKLLAEQMLDNAMLRDINSKQW